MSTIKTTSVSPGDSLRLSSERGRLAFVSLIAAVAAIGGFLFGFDSSVINGTVAAVSDTFHVSGLTAGFSVAALLLGCAFGAFVAGTLADRFGRRPVMIGTAIVFALSALGVGAAQHVLSFMICRLLGGLGVGAASVIAPAYIAEVSPPPYRGRLGSIQQLAIVLGIFLAFVSNYLIARAAGGAAAPWLFGFAAWRWMLWMEFLPAVVFLIGACLIPESPRWLISQHRDAEGSKVFTQLLGREDVSDRVENVKASLAQDHRPSLSDLFEPGTRRLRGRVWIGIGLSVFQQFVGINVIFYYGSLLWQAAGNTESHSLLLSVITGTTNIIATVVAIALIDRIGRRALLAIGSAGMIVTLAALSLALFSGSSHGGHLSAAASWTAMISANIYIFFFGVSWGPVVWVMLGEMFSNQYRGAALAVGAASQWLANFLVTLTFPSLLKHMGPGMTFAGYGAAAFLSWIFVLRVVPETKGQTLEKMTA